ncbi:transposase [Vibrio crassostreae]|uniref:Uncharacterized protein n=1 Tax=Vibrio crassostreae TaxID=246167 RepID=A0ABM9QML5_9VIBR|nr:transposase [Vibrio crassostreae]CAK1911110.1 transposase [Vibrio crassostreae]CAK1911727.1 transposase [Vibrio crassostreae]CAK1920797.1 transposase [Vibrio crassostreae]CAK2017286.1 transposase [Vibrio crassostreae]
MRLYLEASINFLDGYPASERTPEYWLSWSLEYLCVEHVKRRISKRNGISHDFEQSNCRIKTTAQRSRNIAARLKPHKKYDLIVTL